MEIAYHQPYQEYDDHKLIDLVFSGNDEAMLFLLFKRYLPLLKKLCRRYYGDLFYLGFGAGFLLGSVVVMFVVAVLILVVFVRVLFAMLGSSGSASRPGGGNSQKKHYYLDDGTEVEEVGNNIYEDVAGYARYHKGVFTDEFEKIDW